MRAVDVIRKKRDGGALTHAEIDAFVRAAASGAWADYQLSALLMAIFFRGMSAEETAWLTGSMARSGLVLDLSDVPGPKVDKHSTGGVGDKTSIILAPLAAACGAIVPMMSGRGLGHTGGTLDKLESIPGFRVHLSVGEFRTALRAVGAAMIGQTAEVAPADKKLYALRDVTGTVECMPLITSSILAKKIAEGIQGLVMDVKCGRGAFMKTRSDARQLAELIAANGTANGVRTEAMITAMDAPLGHAVGNALEVIECLEVLKGRGPADLVEVSVALTARMLVLGRVADTLAEGEARARVAIASGIGLERFRQIVEQQGGDPRIVDDYHRLPSAPERHIVAAARAGFLMRLDAELVGRASVGLGAGRDRVEDSVDAGVGIMVVAKPGDELAAGDPILELHYRERGRLDQAIALARQAIEMGDRRPAAASLIVGEVL
jgi:pyrimidine-nucleoside phosphorylase